MSTDYNQIKLIIYEYLQEIKDSSELQTGRASEMLVELSAYMANVVEEIRDATVQYNHRLSELLDEPKMTVNKAEIKVKTMPEWERLEKAKGLEKTMTEVIRSLKVFIRVRGDEYEVSANL